MKRYWILIVVLEDKMNTTNMKSHVVPCDEYEDEFLALVAKVSHFESVYQAPNEFLKECAVLSGELPLKLRRRLLDFRYGIDEPGVLLLQGLPLEPSLPPTPEVSTRRIDKETEISETLISLIGGYLGDLIAYSQEKQGEIFQNLYPVRGEEKRQSSESSDVYLEFHTETAFHPERCEYLILYCHRSDHEGVAKTTFASIHDILPKLSQNEIEILSESLFTYRIDYSFHGIENHAARSPLSAVLYDYPKFPKIIYDEDMTEATTDASQNALDKLNEVAHEVTQGVALRPGNMLIVDNYRVVHGRTAFKPRYDGQDRWLQRSFVARDLRQSATVRDQDSRVISRDFSSW